MFFYSCPVCKSESRKLPVNIDGEGVSCPRCGEFTISGSALSMLKISPPKKRQIANLSGWICENQGAEITSNNFEELLTQRSPTVSERAEKLMIAIERKSKFIGDKVAISYEDTGNPWLSYSWSQSSEELRYIVEKFLCDEQKWISRESDLFKSNAVQITPSGYGFLEKIRQGQGVGHQGFCAMWFSNDVLRVWNEAISPAINEAGYRPVRIDEVNHNNRIDDEIMVQIRRSRFVVADFTGNRGGVYFEAGFALGLGLPVIWTVQDAFLANIHFDTRQYNFLQWSVDDLPAFKKALQSRIEATATLGRGPLWAL